MLWCPPMTQIFLITPEAFNSFPEKKNNWGRRWFLILREATLCLLSIPEEIEINTSPRWWCDRTSPKFPLRTPSIRYGPTSRKMKCRNRGLPAAWFKRITNVRHFSLTFNAHSQFTQWLQVHSPPFTFSPSLYVYIAGKHLSRQMQTTSFKLK